MHKSEHCRKSIFRCLDVIKMKLDPKQSGVLSGESKVVFKDTFHVIVDTCLGCRNGVVSESLHYLEHPKVGGHLLAHPFASVLESESAILKPSAWKKQSA